MDFTRWILFVWINISLTNAEIKVKLPENRKQAKKMHRHRTVHQKKSAANRGKPPLEHGSQYNSNTGAKQDTAQYICREMDIAVQAGSGNQESQNICCDTSRAVI